MLLVCKAASKKSDSRFKVLKQPFIIDRLVIHELPRDPPFLAVIYLTEYKVPATAFLLTCSDNKLLKVSTYLGALEGAIISIAGVAPIYGYFILTLCCVFCKDVDVEYKKSARFVFNG